MARPEKPGLDYINIEVDIFEDPKLMFVYERFAEKGELITMKLLLFIYKQGYFTDWDDEVAVLFANRKFKNVSFDLVKDVVQELLKRKFFDEGMFKKFGILTSRGIQKRWQKVVKDCKRKAEIRADYGLLDEFLPQIQEETPAITELTTPKGIEIPEKQEETTHSKEQKIIKKESIWITTPTEDVLIDLPKAKIDKAIERIKIQRQHLLTSDEVISQFNIFKSIYFTGSKFYKDESEVYTHFSNWLKDQKFIKKEGTNLLGGRKILKHD